MVDVATVHDRNIFNFLEDSGYDNLEKNIVKKKKIFFKVNFEFLMKKKLKIIFYSRYTVYIF